MLFYEILILFLYLRTIIKPIAIAKYNIGYELYVKYPKKTKNDITKANINDIIEIFFI